MLFRSGLGEGRDRVALCGHGRDVAVALHRAARWGPSGAGRGGPFDSSARAPGRASIGGSRSCTGRGVGVPRVPELSPAARARTPGAALPTYSGRVEDAARWRCPPTPARTVVVGVTGGCSLPGPGSPPVRGALTRASTALLDGILSRRALRGGVDTADGANSVPAVQSLPRQIGRAHV